MDPRDVMQATKAKMSDIGAAFYFHPDTLARGKELGLSGMRFYALGRAGVLGDADPAVVQSAFGYFHPDRLTSWLVQAREVMSPRDCARAYIACNHHLGRTHLDGLEGLDAFVEAASTVIGAVDGAALALFAALRAEPVPEDAPAAAIHQAMVLRELRGGAHLVAVAAVGLHTSVAHAIKRPDDLGLFGYDEPPVVTDADRAKLERAETITDDVLEPAYAVLTESGCEALISGTDTMHAALTGG